MFRVVSCLALSMALLACGPRPRPMTDAGEEMDAGMMEVDAGRARGDDPPNGWQVALELPAGAAASSKLGVSVAALGDQFGQPVIAAVYEDPNGDLNYDDNRVVFTRWNGTDKAFEAQKIIEVIGGGANPAGHRQVSISRDEATGRIAIAYVKPQDNSVRLAVTDDEGTNFSLSTVSDVSAALQSSPVVVLQGGVAHVAWLQGSNVMYRKREGASGSFTDLSLGSAVTATGRSLAMAVDSAGNPGLAFFVGVNVTSADLAFWRPGTSANAIASADMLDLTTMERNPSVAITFVGTTPHLAYHLRKLADAEATELWYLKATDSGSTWATPVAVPRNTSTNGTHSTRFYQAIAIEPSGRVSIAAPWSATGTQTNCVGPKLARSTDNGASFATCSPQSSPVQREGGDINLFTHRLGKQTLVFFYNSRANPSLKGGVVMWREP
jgi:hypothetical protein